MHESFQSLLDYDKDEDLQRMYALLARIPDGLEPLRNKFEEHVKKAGLAAVARLVGEGSAAGEVDPKAYVDALLEVHRKSSETVKRSFKGEAGFVASLDKACRDFVNKNAATGISSTKSPELLAKHADALLRKNNKMAEEEDLESAHRSGDDARDILCKCAGLVGTDDGGVRHRLTRTKDPDKKFFGGHPLRSEGERETFRHGYDHECYRDDEYLGYLGEGDALLAGGTMKTGQSG